MIPGRILFGGFLLALGAWLAGCSSATYPAYGPELCRAMGGRVNARTEYRSARGPWLVSARYCCLEQSTE